MTEIKGDDFLARPQRYRRVCDEPEYDSFIPEGISCGELVMLTLDEYETIRIVDYEGKKHEQCAAMMDISRTTVSEIYESARSKIADCLVNGKRLYISGGHYRFCDGTAECCIKECRKRNKDFKRVIFSSVLEEKGAGIMRVAVTYEGGNIFQHFGHTEQFKFYDIEDKEIVNEQIVDTMGSGHGALAGFLLENSVDVLICGGIGGGAKNALTDAGIKLYGGVSGSADDAVKVFIDGKLEYNPDVMCSHHEHEHSSSCGEKSCGEDKHGCHGN